MSFYSAILFVHVVGALTLFMALAVEWSSLRQMQRATSLMQATFGIKMSSGLRPMTMASMLVVILSGGYLASRMEVWREAWIWAALAGMFLIGGIAVTLTRRRMEEIRRLCADENAGLTEGLIARLRDPALQVSMRLRIATATGIIFLMVTKPNLFGALLALGIATLAGVLPVLSKQSTFRGRNVPTRTA
jgi:hypothetical protein